MFFSNSLNSSPSSFVSWLSVEITGSSLILLGCDLLVSRMLVAEVYMFSPMLDIEKVGSMLVRSWMLDSRLPEGSKLE